MSLKTAKHACLIYTSVINMERKLQSMINDLNVSLEDLAQLRQELDELQKEESILTDSDLEQIYGEFRNGIKTNFIPLIKHYRNAENLSLSEAKHKADEVWYKLCPTLKRGPNVY